MKSSKYAFGSTASWPDFSEALFLLLTLEAQDNLLTHFSSLSLISPIYFEAGSCFWYQTGPYLPPRLPDVDYVQCKRWMRHPLFTKQAEQYHVASVISNNLCVNCLQIYYKFCAVCKTVPCDIHHFESFLLKEFTDIFQVPRFMQIAP